MKAPSERASGPLRLDVTLAALLQDWRGAAARARAYLGALGFERAAAADVAIDAVEAAATRRDWPAEADAHGETLAGVRRAVAGAGDGDEARFLAWRLSRALGEGRTGREATPPVARGSMVPHRIERRGLRRRLVSSRDADPWSRRGRDLGRRVPRATRVRRLRLRWVRAAFRRRALLVSLVLIPSVVASEFMVEVLPQQGRTPLEMAIVFFFGALFGWISIGFWTALAGFFVLLFGRDRFAITRLEDQGVEVDSRSRTAVVMPICEEPVDRVFAGLRAMYRSLERTGALGAFDFFVLSDTADPSTAIAEEEAWRDWCRAVGGFGRVCYRRRRIRIERKSGNVADFCRRFGRRYRYMITLDADSVMTGEAMVRLVRMMEARPEVGLIQTAPTAIHARSLYARIQQFANRIYGPLFAAGLHFWELGDAQYWGHNAIVRIAPFMEHCSLPRLPGRPPLGGEILSHDFVEAAMLGRVGYSIWIAYDVGGSWEELPSSLLEDLQRDRRWCQGNLQHFRLVFVEGLFHVHRVLFLNGVLSYVSALLWFCFLTLSSAEAVLDAIRVPDYFPRGPSLFPQWPIWHREWAVSLFTVTLVILFIPKILAVVLVLVRGAGARAFGGFVRFGASVVLEVVASSLLAPIRMLFHTKFVLTNLAGRVVAWRSPPRGVNETGWVEALRRHGAATVFATAWGAAVYRLNPEYFWWLTPIVGALILSVPLSVLASRVRLGDAACAIGLFRTPEETAPPAELVELRASLAEAAANTRALPPAERDGFVRAIVDPWTNALHRSFLGAPRRLRSSVRDARAALASRALDGGPSALGARERRVVLLDPALVDELHRRVWALPDAARARRWGRPGEDA